MIAHRLSDTVGDTSLIKSLDIAQNSLEPQVPAEPKDDETSLEKRIGCIEELFELSAKTMERRYECLELSVRDAATRSASELQQVNDLYQKFSRSLEERLEKFSTYFYKAEDTMKNDLIDINARLGHAERLLEVTVDRHPSRKSSAEVQCHHTGTTEDLQKRSNHSRQVSFASSEGRQSDEEWDEVKSCTSQRSTSSVKDQQDLSSKNSFKDDECLAEVKRLEEQYEEAALLATQKEAEMESWMQGVTQRVDLLERMARANELCNRPPISLRTSPRASPRSEMDELSSPRRSNAASGDYQALTAIHQSLADDVKAMKDMKECWNSAHSVLTKEFRELKERIEEADITNLALELKQLRSDVELEAKDHNNYVKFLSGQLHKLDRGVREAIGTIPSSPIKPFGENSDWQKLATGVREAIGTIPSSPIKPLGENSDSLKLPQQIGDSISASSGTGCESAIYQHSAREHRPSSSRSKGDSISASPRVGGESAMYQHWSAREDRPSSSRSMPMEMIVSPPQVAKRLSIAPRMQASGLGNKSMSMPMGLTLSSARSSLHKQTSSLATLPSAMGQPAASPPTPLATTASPPVAGRGFIPKVNVSCLTSSSGISHVSTPGVPSPGRPSAGICKPTPVPPITSLSPLIPNTTR